MNGLASRERNKRRFMDVVREDVKLVIVREKGRHGELEAGDWLVPRLKRTAQRRRRIQALFLPHNDGDVFSTISPQSIHQWTQWH